MPLALGDYSTERKQLIVWDEKDKAQAEEAQRKAQLFKRLGFKVVKEEPGEIALDPPPRGPNIGVFRICSDNGDDRLVWDRTVVAQVKEAYQKFRDFIAKGYRAYASLANGAKGPRIEDFDPGLEEILLLPKEFPG